MNKTLVADVYKLHGTASVSMSADSLLEDVIGTFVREPSLRGVFLVDSKQRFVCMVTRIDLIKWAHLQLTGGKGGHEMPISEFFRIIDAKRARDLACRGRQALSVKESDSLQAALNKMSEYEEDVIPVLDSESGVLGDLRLSEVLWWVLAHGTRTTQR
jgi:CBS domain-containing protein